MAERPGSSVSFGSNPMNSQTNLQPEKVVPKNVKKKNMVVRFFGGKFNTKEKNYFVKLKLILVCGYLKKKLSGPPRTPSLARQPRTSL
jgi:hypothetical protein